MRLVREFKLIIKKQKMLYEMAARKIIQNIRALGYLYLNGLGIKKI